MARRATPDPARSCKPKVRHRNARAAQKAIDAMIANGKLAATCHTYHCKHCGGWHVGNTSRVRGKAAKAQRLSQLFAVIDRANGRDAAETESNEPAPDIRADRE